MRNHLVEAVGSIHSIPGSESIWAFAQMFLVRTGSSHAVVYRSPELSNAS
jgi:hypothetical protein